MEQDKPEITEDQSHFCLLSYLLFKNVSLPSSYRLACLQVDGGVPDSFLNH
jgi:hypothetical protein